MNLWNACQFRIHHGIAITHARTIVTTKNRAVRTVFFFTIRYAADTGSRLASDPFVNTITPHRKPYNNHSRSASSLSSRNVSHTSNTSRSVERLVSHTHREAHAISNGKAAYSHAETTPAVSPNVSSPIARMVTQAVAANA